MCEGHKRLFILNLFPACDEIREAGQDLDRRGQAETESIRINGRCSDTLSARGENVLNIDLVINRPNKYEKPQCSADNIKGFISSQIFDINVYVTLLYVQPMNYVT